MNEEKKYNQKMVKKEMSIEEAETIIDDMYQDKNKIIGEGNTIFVDKIGTVEYTNLEFASVRALREIQSLRRIIEKQAKEIENLVTSQETLRNAINEEIKSYLDSGYSIKDEYVIRLRNLLSKLNLKEVYNFEKYK